jgi:hypothetical protein
LFRLRAIVAYDVHVHVVGAKVSEKINVRLCARSPLIDAMLAPLYRIGRVEAKGD